MRKTDTFTWPAPSLGWVTSGNITRAATNAAERLDNWFPTSEGAELRGGSELHATLDAKPIRFIPYEVFSGPSLFAATASDIYEIAAPADAEVTPTASLSGLNSGDWSSVQFGTAAGQYAVAVNGTDGGIYYDGANMLPLVGETVYALEYDALSGDFTVGNTVTGGTSSASAEILGIAPSSATAGTLYIGAITSGPFQDNEALTDGLTGAATSDIPSGTSTASSITITNVATSALSVVWRYAERLFFVEKGTLSAWYLPADSIGGAASEIDLSSVFAEGGSLLTGATWSLDSGSGLDDKCVFITDTGEVAVYSGSDPSSSSTWALEGVYRLPPPVDKHGAYNHGGELMIVANAGILRLSQAISRELSEVVRGAFTAAIEDQWQNIIAQRTSANPVCHSLWHTRGWLMVSSPSSVDGLDMCFVANTRTGAWCRFLGWDVKASVVFGDKLYFGTDAGLVLEADTSGSDNGMSYTAYYIPKFSEMGAPNIKIGNRVGFVTRSSVRMKYATRLFKDYEQNTIPITASLSEPEGSALWGYGTWGESVWGGDTSRFGSTTWKAVGAKGFSLAPGISVTNNTATKPRVEIAATMLRYEVGEIL